MKKFKQLLCIALFFASLSVQASSKVIMNYKGGKIILQTHVYQPLLFM